jgi:N-acetylglucosaminyl-diphospho-decaprenol L-rhamnosyltransferase
VTVSSPADDAPDAPLRLITVSVVSHGQNRLANSLLADLDRLCSAYISIVATENVADRTPLALDALSCPHRRIVNAQPLGYGANHNAAFEYCRTPFYCVANPDVRLTVDPFPALLAALDMSRASAAGPMVRSPQGAVEDSARRSPTALSLLRKLFAGSRGPDYPVNRGPLEVDWVAGMFILFRTDAFRTIGGFDEAYFLYYEDVDLCRRLRRRGDCVIYEPSTEVIHDARRSSRHDWRLMRHHLRGIARYLRG